MYYMHSETTARLVVEPIPLLYRQHHRHYYAYSKDDFLETYFLTTDVVCELRTNDIVTYCMQT